MLRQGSAGARALVVWIRLRENLKQLLALIFAVTWSDSMRNMLQVSEIRLIIRPGVLDNVDRLNNSRCDAVLRNDIAICSKLVRKGNSAAIGVWRI